jgi:hypothetical protein
MGDMRIRKDGFLRKGYPGAERRNKITAVPPVLLLEVTAIGEDAVPTLQ